MMTSNSVSSAAFRTHIHAHVNARSLDAALHARRYALSKELGNTNRAAVLLLTGNGSVADDNQVIELHAPALIWLPVAGHHFLHIEAGSTGYLLGLSGELAKDSIGQSAEAEHLRYLVDRPVMIGGIQVEEAVDGLSHSFGAILREVRREERGSWNFLSAHVALVLIHCWRLSGCEDLSQQAQGFSSSLLLRFRHLVELHFRVHWTVAHYAQALGIPPDRLHDLCTRTLRRTPLELLHDRLNHEAKLLLVRSGLTIEQVADDLGFKSTTHFSRLFRQKTGSTPASYRKTAQGPAVAVGASRSYADWP